MTGRTSWWAHDAAMHRRERLVELGEDHGPAGPNVLVVLHSWAQEQGHTGDIKGGFRALGREAFVSPADARKIVEHAAEIGALDDLVIEADGKRFTARVSGWESEQRKAREAARKAKQRATAEAKNAPRDNSGQNGTSPAVSPEVPRSALHHITSTSPDQTDRGGGSGASALVRLDSIDLALASDRFQSAWPMEAPDVRTLIAAEPAAVQDEVVTWLLAEYGKWESRRVRPYVESVIGAVRKKNETPRPGSALFASTAGGMTAGQVRGAQRDAEDAAVIQAIRAAEAR